MHNKKLLRLLAAFAREGLDVRHDDGVWSVRLDDDNKSNDDHRAEVLLPDGFAVEGKALKQLAQLAATKHPHHGEVCRCAASPDFHPGDGGVAIGSVAEMDGLIVPAAVGSDIHCGMRLHLLDVDADRFAAVRDDVVADLRGQYFGGTRDLPLHGDDFRALFHDGLAGVIARWRRPHVERRGLLAGLDLDALDDDLHRTFDGGTLQGSSTWMPDGLLIDGFVRDDGLGTIGGGNHFVEVQVVDDVVDRSAAYALGVRRGQLAVMIHSGSRHIGKHIGGIFANKAREAWPVGHKHPPGALFGVSSTSTPQLFDDYLGAEAAAGHYAWLNRLLLGEMFAAAVRRRCGDVAMPLVYDLPHNLTRKEGERHVVRKGACPAHAGQPVIIPGSMGASSYLGIGRGNDRFLSTASHGAGRATSRHEMGRLSMSALGLEGVDCVTPRPERRIEEAPAAYKPIDAVIDVQVRAGIIDVVARLKPLLTFKA
ncbi:MAG TPA: RtcB family protein [Myxococcota bacterium]